MEILSVHVNQLFEISYLKNREEIYACHLPVVQTLNVVKPTNL